MKVILASASERRQELLSRIVENFTILVSEFDEEKVKKTGNISDYVENIALGKARDVLSKVSESSIIIAADTVVSLDNEILGKPKDKSEAYEMLSKLSGNTHNVYTGIVIINTDSGKTLKDFVETQVVFSKLTEKQIKDYIATGDPMDKAGAYGIQGKAGVFVKEIRGCYYNVVGLPLNKLNEMIERVI
ncbi:MULTISPECIES: Maf-like protein [Clostridium]|uniref:dTTP/UTP pyrophosphatase n=1 Tax=Clostridium cibarium TaxID=2762247 RepID=A0ABR8PRA8_9CLOT|nr:MULTISPECIES: Maf-like protein [Clostridium]MBD7910660.1 Maf-like protein [Clostridium cibarium]